MKAVVFHGVGDIRLDEVKEPTIQEDTDAIVRLTASAICGTDLHMVRGTMSGMVKGTILGHEGVGIVEEVGKQVRNLRPGDRVVIPSTIACGNCAYCRFGYFAQCDEANPNGPAAGTAFFGGPKMSGPFHGLQAEKARVPFANIGLVKLPDEVDDDSAIMISDIFPTGYMGAEMAEIHPGTTVAVFGCGPVGQFTIASAKLLGAARIFAIDTVPSRLEMAQSQGAEVIDYNAEDPIEALRELTKGIGPDRTIDAVGVDANRPEEISAQDKKEFAQEEKQVAPKAEPHGDNWHPGNAPSQVLQWVVESVAKAGTISIIGVYSDTVKRFPVGEAMEKNLRLNMGNCNHRKYIPRLVELVRTEAVEPAKILTQAGPLVSAIDAYKHFDRREEGWMKVKLEPAEEELKVA